MIDIVGKRYWFFLLSFLILLPGIISLGIFRLNLGIEFTSGSTLTLVFEQPAEEAVLRQQLSQQGYGEAIVQGTSKPGFLVQTNSPLTEEQIEITRNVLEAKFGSRNAFLYAAQGAESTTLTVVLANPVSQEEFQDALSGLDYYDISSISPTQKEAFLVRLQTLGQESGTIVTRASDSPGNLRKTSPDNVDTPAFAWDALVDAVSYEVKIDTGSYTNIGNELTYALTTSLSDGAHSFYVQAVGEAGNLGTAGGIGFIVDITPPTNSSDIAWISSGNNSTPTFSWSSATDATSGIASYEVKMDSSDWTDIGNVTTYTHSVTLSEGSHTFSVRAKDAAGNTSNGEVLEFSLDTAPAVPPLVYPVDGAKSNDTTPIFDWSEVSDLSGYTLQIDDSPDFSSPVSKPGLVLSEYKIASGEALSQGIYYWRVNAKDGTGNESNWTTVRSFSVDTTAPPVPSLAYPADGVKIKDTTPAFDWSAVSDPSGVSYHFQADNDSNFSSLVIEQIGLGNSTYIPGVALAESTYYWKVKAMDGAGNESEWSAVWSFTIDATASDSPGNLRKTSLDNDNTPAFAWDALADAVSYEVKIDTGSYINIENELTYALTTSLSDGAHSFYVQAVGEAGNLGTAGGIGFIVDITPPTAPSNIIRISAATNSTPTFSWSRATDATSGVASYEVKIDSGDWTPIGNVTTYTHSTALSEGDHTFSIRAKDAAGNTSNEQVLASPLNTIPEAPALLSPANGAKSNDTTPALDWSEVSDPSGISYTLQIDNSPDFSSLVLSETGLALSQYQVTPEEALSQDIYYWRVNAKDGTGNESIWTTVRSFSVDTTAPPVPTLAYPADAVKIKDTTPAFDWFDVSDPSGISYHLQADNDSDFSSLAIEQTGLDNSTYTSGVALAESTYYWKVKAVDGAGIESDWSAVWSFNADQGIIIEPSELEKLEQGLQGDLGSFALFDFFSVSPVVATQVVRYAAIAVLVASLAIFLYIAWAFRQMPQPFRYGICAIIALVHDALLLIGVFSLLGKFAQVEVDAMFITAVLLVVGYSVNDTVVVFDRIRENMTKGIARDFGTVVNLSLVQTLTRSLNTTLTTLLVIFALFFLGGVTLRHFMLALLIGIATGAYSSIFVASPLLVVWEKREWGRFFHWIRWRRKAGGKV